MKTEEATSPPRYAITDEEKIAFESEYERIGIETAREEISVRSPQWFHLAFNKDACSKIDPIISKCFDRLRAKKIDDFAEKFLDYAVSQDNSSDNGNLALACVRLLDTVECIIALKGKFRGRSCSTKYTRQAAMDELRARKLMK